MGLPKPFMAVLLALVLSYDSDSANAWRTVFKFVRMEPTQHRAWTVCIVLEEYDMKRYLRRSKIF